MSPETAPPPGALNSAYSEAVDRTASLPGRAQGEDALAVLRARVRPASDRLAAAVSFREPKPWRADEVADLRTAALSLAAELVRGLNDSLQTGVLDGYVAINATRLPGLVADIAGPPTMSSVDDGVSIDGRLAKLNRHVAPLLQPDSPAEVVAREGFAAIGAAAAVAAYLVEPSPPA